VKRTPLQRHTPIRRVSPRRRALLGERAALRLRVLLARPVCEAGARLEAALPGHRCERDATDVHEPLTRARGGSIVDEANSLAVCRACHDAIHRHPTLATALGLLVSAYPGRREVSL
jgi:hypothetical protein